MRSGRNVVLVAFVGLAAACGEEPERRVTVDADRVPEARDPVPAAVRGGEGSATPAPAAERPRPKSFAGDKACRADPAGCVRRAVALTRTDLPRAAAMFEVACNEGDAAGCGNFAVMLRDGRGVGEDRDRAAELLEDACRRGHAPSCDNRRALDR